MRQPSEIEVLYLDFDGFFASVEQQADARLRGRPVGIVPFAGTTRTCVIACSREAKAFGIKNVMNVEEAKQRCQELVLVPQRPDLYRRAECDTQNALFLLLKSCGDAFDGAVAGAAERFAGMAERAAKELASIFSTAMTQLAFLDSNAMASVLTKSDLRLAELKSGRTTLYLCLPATRMATR